MDELTTAVQLLNQRASVSLEIGRLKASDNALPFVPSRERVVFENVRRANAGPLRNEHLETIYRTILATRAASSACCAWRILDRPAHSRIRPRSSSSARRPTSSGADHHRRLPGDAAGRSGLRHRAGGELHEGAVLDTIDNFMKATSRSAAELGMPIEQNLWARRRARSLRSSTRTPQGLRSAAAGWRRTCPRRSCRHREHRARRRAMLRRTHPRQRISPEAAAAIYGLEILDAGIQDNPNNITRFHIVGAEMSRPSGRDKAGIVVTVKDRWARSTRRWASSRGAASTSATSSPVPPDAEPGTTSSSSSWVGTPRSNRRGRAQGARGHCMFVKVLGAWPVI